MINVDKIRGLIAERGLTKAEAAQKFGMTPNTLNRKMKIGIFRTDEIEKMIDVLNIRNPGEIFFAD